MARFATVTHRPRDADARPAAACLLALLIAICLGACGGDADEGSVPPGAAPVAPDGEPVTPDTVSDPTSPESGQSAGQTFHIDPVRPVPELEAEALAAEPPAEEGEFLEPDLVELISVDPDLRLEIRYASDDNFLGTPVYRQPRAFLQRPAAEALARAHRRLRDQGYGLLIYDAYRPWYVTKIFWDATPEEHKVFVADPAEGSRHNRGCAVDLTLIDLATGAPVTMPSGYDEFSDSAHSDYAGGTEASRRHRDALRAAMEAEGFTVYPEEWWHYDYDEWRRYPIGNATFEELTGEARS